LLQSYILWVRNLKKIKSKARIITIDYNDYSDCGQLIISRRFII